MRGFYGTGVALVTPFREDLSIDEDALISVVEHAIAGGVNYLVVLGTTAESVTLTISEKNKVAKLVAKINAGRLPLVIGIGGNNTMAVAEELQTTSLSEYDAILSVSPYYNKPTQEGIYQHFKVLSKASPLPIIMYNVPGRTASNMLPNTVARLANDFENIIGIKEALGDMVQVNEMISSTPDNFLVISGDDVTALPSVLAGGAGVISVIGQGLPNEFSTMINLALEGRNKEAYKIHNSLLDIVDLIFEEGNPAGIKSLFHAQQLCESWVRLPLIKASPALAQRIALFFLNFSKKKVKELI